MITIEDLRVTYDAERERDEARFAELFAKHMTPHEDRRQRAIEAEARARRERSVPNARGSW